MSNTQHTPGPWRFTERRDDFVVKGVDASTVAYTETIYNARLIAAAPDLLAELQNIANADPRKWDEETRDQFQQWAQSRARFAIAKATGGAV